MLTRPACTCSAKRSPLYRSPVKIAASSPYGDSLVSSIACSSESISTTGAIGPNVSATAAGDHRGSAADGVGHVLVHLRGDALVVERAHLGALGERVAQPRARRRT